MELGLSGRSVIVCASSEGIGLASAQQFAQEGARVAMCSRDAEKLESAAETVRKYGNQVIAQALDVTDSDALRAFVDKVAVDFGGVEVCVANAGGPPARTFLDTNLEEWDQAYKLNLKSVVALAHLVLPHMCKQRWGRMITITSVSVRQPVDDLVYPNTVRAGVAALVKVSPMSLVKMALL